MKARVIAFYLPQFHPIPENDRWWGKGFTEWTNVGSAKPLFRGHYQPRVPADLGYYDLRLPEIRKAQADLAAEAGISAFCYWHYWFNGKRLLELPLEEVLRLREPNFPFCLGWANHPWERKDWSAGANHLVKETLIEQTYGGTDEIDQHFNTMLPAFKDDRYFKIRGKLSFTILLIKKLPYLPQFIERWQNLALQNGLPGFHFSTFIVSTKDLEHPSVRLCDGSIPIQNAGSFSRKRVESNAKSILSMLLRRPLCLEDYRKAMSRVNIPEMRLNNVYPTIYPNFDHSPRSGVSAQNLLHNSRPEYFLEHVRQTLELVRDKPEEDRIVFLKSWNEWGEGNYMEPDLRFGKGYIHALRQALDE